MGSLPELRSKLESAARANQIASGGKLAAIGSVVEVKTTPTIKLKTDFSNFTGNWCGCRRKSNLKLTKKKIVFCCWCWWQAEFDGLEAPRDCFVSAESVQYRFFSGNVSTKHTVIVFYLSNTSVTRLLDLFFVFYFLWRVLYFGIFLLLPNPP